MATGRPGASIGRLSRPVPKRGRARILPVGDGALTIELGEGIDPAVNRSVRALMAALERTCTPGVLELVPTYRALLVQYDDSLLPLRSLLGLIRRLEAGLDHEELPPSRVVEIPTYYGSTFGPDLADVARLTGMGEEEVIDLHTSVEYEVYMLGFTPGFCYLGGLSPRLAVPRLSTPRSDVRPGSVGIGGNQTGIYSVPGPGGWRLIGWTPVQLWETDREQPYLLSPGDRLRFVPVPNA